MGQCILHHAAQNLRGHKLAVQSHDSGINKWWLQHLRAMPQRHVSPLMAVAFSWRSRFVPGYGIVQERRRISEPKDIGIGIQHRALFSLGCNGGELKAPDTLSNVIGQLWKTSRQSRQGN